MSQHVCVNNFEPYSYESFSRRLLLLLKKQCRRSHRGTVGKNTRNNLHQATPVKLVHHSQDPLKKQALYVTIPVLNLYQLVDIPTPFPRLGLPLGHLHLLEALQQRCDALPDDRIFRCCCELLLAPWPRPARVRNMVISGFYYKVI